MDLKIMVKTGNEKLRMFSKAKYIYKTPPASIILLSLGLTLGIPAARADDFIVYSPYVVQGQSEIEFRGDSYKDSNPSVDGTSNYQFSVAHAFTTWWRPEIYVAEYQHTPGQGQQSQGYEFENVFQMTDPGEYWADAGFLASYEYHTVNGQPDALEFGPLFEKQSGRLVNRVNFIWEKEVGADASRDYELRAAYSLSYKWSSAFQPGVETYIRPADNAYQIGPVFYGELASNEGNEFEYSAGVVFGANHGAPDQVFVLRLEYEFF
jgi:hypothetical protein